MKNLYLLGLAVCVLGVLGQEDPSEETNFDVTEALLARGIDAAHIPHLGQEGCAIACASLNQIYGDELFIKESPEYNNVTDTYWSMQQSTIEPTCIFAPGKSSEVASLVLLSRLTRCPFAVKGGGHAAFPNASNIDGGITVSMHKFNQVDVSQDKKTVNIGPGLRWAEVYERLEEYDVGVLGGRVATVGVSGLLLGGGISFFWNERGWACDNIASYEVVTASGKIITASLDQHSDLYWALKGGSGGNFGVVTNFELEAFPFPGGLMWGGGRVYSADKFPAVLDAYYNFATISSSEDTDAAQIVSFSSFPGVGDVAVVQLHHLKPEGGNSSAFNAFNAIEHVPSTSTTAGGTHANMTLKLNEGQYFGFRQTYWNFSFKVNRDLLTFALDTFTSLRSTVQDLEETGGTYFTFQAITAGQLKGMQRNGGNALGLDLDEGPYMIMNLGCQWNMSTNDAAYYRFMNSVIQEIKTEAQAKGLDNDFIYMNYATLYQNPIASYGTENVETLRQVGKKYDPIGVFQVLHPGYFKLAATPPEAEMPFNA